MSRLTRTLSAPHTGWWWSAQEKSHVAPKFEFTCFLWVFFWVILVLFLSRVLCLLVSFSSSLQSTFKFLRLTLRMLERSWSFGTERLFLPRLWSLTIWSTRKIFVSPSRGVETQNWREPSPSRRTVRPCWVKRGSIGGVVYMIFWFAYTYLLCLPFLNDLF